MNANPRARNPPKSNGNLQKSIVKHPTTCSHMPPPLTPSACGKRWWVLHYGFLQISNGFGWISCMWIRTYIFIIYKAFPKSFKLILSRLVGSYGPMRAHSGRVGPARASPERRGPGPSGDANPPENNACFYMHVYAKVCVFRQIRWFLN